MSELVSIVTPSYNSRRFIEGTIASVRAQTFTDWKMYIIDDASTDDTVDFVEQLAEAEPRIELIRLRTNSGPAVCRNTAIEAARGRYIAFLDSDDLWLPEKLERQIAFMQERQTALSYTAYRKMEEDGIQLRGVVHVPDSADYSRLLMTNVIGCLTAIYDCQQTGKMYMPLIPKRQDYGLWLSILKRGHTAHGLDECLAFYRLRRESVSRNKMLAAQYQWRIYREVEQLPLWTTMCCFAAYAWFGLRKHMI